jgi:HAD superfamily hydrolase (TIGR01484 family)
LFAQKPVVCPATSVGSPASQSEQSYISVTNFVKYRVLASDYDGTLAHDGVLNDATIAALDRFRATGRQLLMVTGREIEDLKQVCSVVDRFDWIVAENGALLYRPSEGEMRLLCEAANPQLVQRLREARVEPFSVGHAIVATREPYQTVVLETIRELGLELQVIFNKGAVMVLPSGVNKAKGLAAALKAINVDASAAVGVGDAENDHAFLELCAVGVAVSNALPVLKERADLVTKQARGEGVTELIDHIIANDLADLTARRREPQPI